MRETLAIIAAPLLRITGYRFSKRYRWGTTAWHRMVYRLINTIECNRLAAR